MPFLCKCAQIRQANLLYALQHGNKLEGFSCWVWKQSCQWDPHQFPHTQCFMVHDFTETMWLSHIAKQREKRRKRGKGINGGTRTSLTARGRKCRNRLKWWGEEREEQERHRVRPNLGFRKEDKETVRKVSVNRKGARAAQLRKAFITLRYSFKETVCIETWAQTER